MKEQEGNQRIGSSIGLHRFAILLSFLTVVLLIAGALVTSNEAGDSVPDWPLSFGRWLLSSQHWVANVRYEYSHRFIAGVVGATTLLLAVWALIFERRPWIRRLALIALAGVVLQAVIGGVRVRFPEYKPLIAVPHALVAQSFFGLIVAIAVFTSRSWLAHHARQPDDGHPPLRTLSKLSLAALLVQLILGAGFRHGAFGIIPHAIGAIVVFLMIGGTSVIALRRRSEGGYLERPARVLLVLLMTQIVLGVSAYLARVGSIGDPQPLEPMISLTVAHVVVGALMLAATIVLVLRSHQVLIPQGQRANADQGFVSPAERAAV